MIVLPRKIFINQHLLLTLYLIGIKKITRPRRSKMSLAIFFAVIAGIAICWYAISSIMIYNELKKRNEKVNFIFIRFLIIPYANKYREITKKENGRVGSLFYHWLISINIALIFTIATMVSMIV